MQIQVVSIPPAEPAFTLDGETYNFCGAQEVAPRPIMISGTVEDMAAAIAKAVSGASSTGDIVTLPDGKLEIHSESLVLVE